MSARFFKIFLSVFMIHLLVLSFVWIGFSPPNSRPPATFIYEGTLAAGDSGKMAEVDWQNTTTADQFSFDRFEASNFNHWIELRNINR